MKTQDMMKQRRAEEELERRNKELTALNRIAQLMSHSMNLRKVLEYALDGVLEVIDMDLGTLYMVDERSGAISCAVHKGLNAELTEIIKKRSTIPPGKSYTRKVVEADNVLTTLNLHEEVIPTSKAIFVRNKLRSAAGIPLKSKGKTLGVMIIISHLRRTFSVEEVRLLETIGNQIGIAIENAKLFEEVSAQSAALESYISQITMAQEEERRRIARDLHDEMAQSLAAMYVGIQGFLRDEKALSDKTIQKLKQLQEEVNIIVNSVRGFIHDLRPEVLDQLGLIPAIELLMTELTNEGSLKARIEIAGNQQRLSADTEVNLFRIAQEAIRNIRKHSQATETVVKIEFGQEMVNLYIIDNGKGFELPRTLNRFTTRGKLGLIGMNERARLLNGNFEVKTGIGIGTRISVLVPK